MARFAFFALLSMFATACVPRLQPCSGCTTDAATDPTDGGVDGSSVDDDAATHDAAIDAYVDAGPTPIRPELDGTTLPDRVCTLGRWCWVSPQVPDAEWSDTAAVSDMHAWVVTEAPVGGTTGGARIYYDGTSWRGLVGVGARRVSGSGASDVWFIAGAHDVSHWDGSELAPVELDEDVTLNDVGSAAADDAWVVGDEGAAWHWSGEEWESLDLGVGFTTDLRAIHVVSASDVWIAGTGGVVRHFDGTAWTVVDAPSDFDIDAIWALADSATVWIGGPSGARYRDATAMEWRTPTGAPAANIVSIAGKTADSVYLLSTDANDFRAFGTALSLLVDGGTECDFRAVAAYGSSYLRVGRRSADGTLACPIDTRPLTPSTAAGTSLVPRPLGDARSFEILGADELLVYSDGHAYRGSPTTGAFATADALVPEGLDASSIVIGASHGASDLFVDTHDGAVLHWNGTAWSSVVVQDGATNVIFATTDEDTWAAAGDTVYAWDGSAFAAVGSPLSSDVRDLAASGTTLFATHDTTLARFADGAWTDLVSAWPTDCRPLVARDETTVECLGTGGRTRFTVGGTPELVTTTSSVPASAPENLYALRGDHGWVFAPDADEQILWPDATSDVWPTRASGVAVDGSDFVRMLVDGTTWRTTGGSLLEWRP